MFQSFIITGNTEEKRIEKALKTFGCGLNEKEIEKIAKTKISTLPDIIITVPENSIGIEEIRNLQKKLLLKPFQLQEKSFIIVNADKLTVEAQNALLKTLEEPPSYVQIFLLSENSNNFLPTVISRCKIVNLQNEKMILTPEERDEQENIIIKLLSKRVGERLILSKDIASTRENTVNWLKNQIIFWKEILLEKIKSNSIENKPYYKLSSEQILRIIRSAQKIKELVEKNINQRLALDNYFLSLPQTI